MYPVSNQATAPNTKLSTKSSPFQIQLLYSSSEQSDCWIQRALRNFVPMLHKLTHEHVSTTEPSSPEYGNSRLGISVLLVCLVVCGSVSGAENLLHVENQEVHKAPGLTYEPSRAQIPNKKCQKKSSWKHVQISKCDSVGSGYMPHCWTSAFDDHSNHGNVILKDVQHRTKSRKLRVRGHNQHCSDQNCRAGLEPWFVSVLV